jgi:ferritin
MTYQESKNENKSRLAPFDREIEECINNLIHSQLQAWYNYTNISQACSQDTVALHGFAEYFCTAAIEVKVDSCAFMRYQNQRGGTVCLKDIKAPKETWTNATETWQRFLDIEKNLAEDLLRLDREAAKKNDYALSNWIARHFLEKSTRHVKDAADIVRQVSRVEGRGDNEGKDRREGRSGRDEDRAGQGIYQLDHEFRENGGVPMFSNRATEPLDLFREIEMRQQQRRRGGAYGQGNVLGRMATEEVLNLVREYRI